MTLIVTTAIDKESSLVKRAQELAQLYGGIYQDRGKRTMKQIYRQAEGALVLNKNEMRRVKTSSSIPIQPGSGHLTAATLCWKP